MSHEVSGEAVDPWRRTWGLLSLSTAILALLLWLAPLLVRDAEPLPEDLPGQVEVERRCRNSREPLSACTRPGLEVGTREALLSFVERLPQREHPIPGLIRLQDDLDAMTVARRYEELRVQLQAEGTDPEIERWAALERSARALLAPLLALLAFVTFLRWGFGAPQRVVLSPGRIRLGPHRASLEDLASWSFSGYPSLTLKDGTRLALHDHQLDPLEADALEAAMKLAMERVASAEPLDASSLRAMRALAQERSRISDLHER